MVVVEAQARSDLQVKLFEAAELARRSIAPGLASADAAGNPEFAGSCLHTSVVLQQLLQRFFSVTAVVRGGAGGESLSGAVDSKGHWHGHFWVEVLPDGDGPGGIGWVVDATGDQFGHAPIRVMSASESFAFFRPVDQFTVDAQVRELLDSVESESDTCSASASPHAVG